ncbi:hpd [Symbiodinium sp. KB8]|nr:hpd [Symbiodinium sp. KB8]
MVASWYASRFGFDYVAYRGLETGYRNSATWVMRQGKILFAFSSVLGPKAEKELGDDMGRHLAVHGDGVKDVAFTVTDARAMYEAAVKRGAVSIREPVEEKDEHGSVVLATVKTYGDTVHTFVERKNYKGAFLPGFKYLDKKDALAEYTAPVGLDYIDHCVGNMPDQGMTPTVEWYEKCLQFHRFWSVDDKQVCSAPWPWFFSWA